MSLSAVGIGLTVETITNLYDLAVPVRPPLVHYEPGTDEVENMDGLVEDIGSPRAELRWDYITRTERDSLRTILGAKSTRVFVHIPTTENGDEYKDFSAIAVWPKEDRSLITIRRDFVILLKNMVEVV